MRIWIATSLLLAAACAENTAPKEDRASPAAENPFKERIAKLPDGQRNAVFLRAIRNAGQNCQNVVGSAQGGEQFGMPSWVARCGDGGDWVIMLSPDGRALVARREEKA